jgi:hypothetical protein
LPKPGSRESRLQDLRQVHLELYNLQKLRQFLEKEAAHPAADLDKQSLHSLQLELLSLAKLELALAEQVTRLTSQNDERDFAVRLFMSKFEYGP